jgi:small subunit ribosomal protein S17
MARTIIGVVSSNKTDKTITVVSHTRKTHPLYRKQYSETKKFLAHDEKNEAEVGDRVSIVETRPISARKHFKLDKIIFKPTLREDALEVTKDEEANQRPDSKSKKTKEEENDTAGK